MLLLSGSTAWATSQHHKYNVTFHLQEAPTTFNATVKQAARHHSAVMITMANKMSLVTQMPLFLSSLVMANPNSTILESLIVIVQAQEDLELCQQLHQSCYLDDRVEVPYVPTAENYEGNILPLETKELSWRRVDFVHHIASMGIGVFATDLDILFFGNPFDLLSNPQYSPLDFFATSEQGDDRPIYGTNIVNIGFCYFAPTQAAVQLAALWRSDKSKWEQPLLGYYILENMVPDLKWQPLPMAIAYSYCHPPMFNEVDGEEAVRNHLGHYESAFYHIRYYEYLKGNHSKLKEMILFHFPCCYYPTGPTCKGFMMSLTLNVMAGESTFLQ